MKTLDDWLKEFDDNVQDQKATYPDLVDFISTMYREVREETKGAIIEELRHRLEKMSVFNPYILGDCDCWNDAIDELNSKLDNL